MKCIAVSQRVDIVQPYGERRDALDQRWCRFLGCCGLTSINVPNNSEYVKNIFDNIAIKGILLTGGNSMVNYGGDAPERDETERFLLKYAIHSSIPLLGVCRGMQVIQDYFNISLQKIDGHAGTEHSILITNVKILVNSYHEWGTMQTNGDLAVWAKSEDGIVEAVSHKDLPIKGIMWHPERFPQFRPDDILLFRDMFF